MSINPQLCGDYITTLKIRQIQNLTDLWNMVSEFQLKNTAKADLMIYTAFLQINNLKFLNNAEISVSDIFKNEKIFLDFCKPFIELQSSLGICSGIEADLMNLQSAVVNGLVDDNFRCPTTSTINKYIRIIDNNDKKNFLYCLESYIRGSATNNTDLVYDVDNIDYMELLEIDTLQLLIDEETEAELEALGIEDDEEEEQSLQSLLFGDLEVQNFRKAGNKYPTKKPKKPIDTRSLFDLGGAA